MKSNNKPVAIITGASRGIGKALALGFISEGYRVVALSRSIETLLTIAKEENFSSSDYLPLQIDLEDTASIPSTVKAISPEFKNIEVLVNNAGTLSLGTLEINPVDFRKQLAVNLESPFCLTKEIVPLMLKNKKGMILNVASLAAKEAFAGFGAYAASKFGLLGLGDSLFREFSSQGIKVTTLCPSWMDTQMAQEAGTSHPGHAMIQPEDIMKTINWLLSLSPAVCVKEVVMECAVDIE